VFRFDEDLHARRQFLRNASNRPTLARSASVLSNLFGMVDLVVAVGMGMMTSPGPAQVFQTTPTSELATRFPLALLPTFLVPLAFTLHVVSLWQLLSRPWVRHSGGPFMS
jgi:hypothetical protein